MSKEIFDLVDNIYKSVPGFELVDGKKELSGKDAFMLYDTFGLVVREAAAVGTPSITVRKSGAAEGIKNGENGFLCKDDPMDLAKVIRAALDNNNLRKTVGDNAKKTLPVPWDKVTDSVLARYQYVISHTRKR